MRSVAKSPRVAERTKCQINKPALYTDDSAEGAVENAGNNVLSADFTLSSAVGKHDGEMTVILALDKIRAVWKGKYWLFCIIQIDNFDFNNNQTHYMRDSQDLHEERNIIEY
ncbi:hypothetical protein TNIN_114321 [Trichonephila inaurata madagascariensis]|uniref:Uncharacterized protein n=1 Tax=Trichonephila inaurata madagascariensis TaxID=2747483 RepID=A0A8X6YPM4_9ARAC|nr:hypothetical protein TNIN_114321 [Trichonephila inaurata madagascariensis]